MTEKRSVLVALSGGVDSSVTAALLKKAGHEVVAVTMKTFCHSEFAEGPKACCGLEGIAAARSVSASLGINHFVIDVSERFKKEVIEDFIREYSLGRTPNPCVICNATVKIPDLLLKAKSLGCTDIATGHYAKIIFQEGKHYLYKGEDSAKDQAYFLWRLPRKIFPNLIFPLGDLTKENVRRIAREFGFVNANRPESQEICFIPDGDYSSFVRKHLPKNHPALKPGEIFNEHGESIGKHDGILNFTIGQRKGIGGGNGRRLYVTGISLEKNAVFVGERKDLSCKTVLLEKMNFLVDEPDSDCEVEIMIRHRAKPLAGVLKKGEDGIWKVELDEVAFAVTPGQSGVFFDRKNKNLLIGGGVIL
ncbi:MAG: tRNA 2-thiouridine(34) synthase MnmA [Candidatus Riflebacteria bacterium]|nr:tRNA 2-thiouridine(34) synthase MnmA [Candidatus Riflebacteria bacterium]